MDKVNQNANRDVNNVKGNQYIINNPIFKSVKGDKVEKFLLEKISNINYFEYLKETLNSKKLISRRAVLEEIETLIHNTTSVLLYGEPGIGKTTLVREILLNNKIIYISLRDRELDEVYIYLIESYGLQFSKEENMVSILEGLMRSSGYLFVFDDCESSKELVRKLELLEKFKNRFLYLSRDKSIFAGINISKYELKQLTKDEVKEFVSLHMENLDYITIDELYIKSKGNPLYLYYYVNYKINPLPSGLESYQEALWESLNPEQREILSCISITNFPIKTEVLRRSLYKITLTKSTLMEFQLKLSSIEYLLDSHKGEYQIFHPLFKEYILEYINDCGIKSEYETIVGKSAFENNDIVEATLLLIDKKDNIIYKYLLEVGIYLYNSSRISLSLKVLEEALIVYKSNKNYTEYYGHTNYHISQIYRDVNNKELGDLCINKAIQVYKDLDDEQGYFLCIVFKATFLAEDGKKAETEKLIEEINGIHFEDENIKGYVYINMSKINLSFNQYESAATNARIAYESFMEINNKDGAIKSLLNYSAALANIEQENLATEYLEKILDNDKLILNKAIQAAVMNNLTSCYRKNKEYDKAIEVCNKSIKISQELGQTNKIVMNLLNLGNVYRDLEDWEKCDSIYLKGVRIAEEQGIIREIGRGNELLASSNYEQKRFYECIKYAEKAIEVSMQVNDDFRVAEAYIEMSKGYLSLEQYVPYINCLEEAIKHYIKENFINESIGNLLKLIKYYINFNEKKVQEHSEKINELINSNIDVDYSLLYYNLKKSFNGLYNNQIVNIYYNIILAYINSNMSVNLLKLLIDFLNVCKKNSNEYSKILFVDVINKFVIKGKENIRAINILAFIIEQSGELLDTSDIEVVIRKLKECYDDIYIRTVEDGIYILTSYWKTGVYLQYVCESNKLINIKVSLAIYLITKFNENFIIENINDVKYTFLDFNIFDFDSVSDTLNEVEFLKESDFEEMPVKLTCGVTSDVTTFIILGNQYENKSNYSINENNKIFIYIIMNVFLQAIRRVKSISIEEADMYYAKKIRKLIEDLTWVKLDDLTSKWIIESLPNTN